MFHHRRKDLTDGARSGAPDLSRGGLLLLLCAAGVFYAPAVSLGGAIIIAVLLLGRFLPSLLEHRDEFGAFLSTTKGFVALLMVSGGVLVILGCGLALAMKGSPPNPP